MRKLTKGGHFVGGVRSPMACSGHGLDGIKHTMKPAGTTNVTQGRKSGKTPPVNSPQKMSDNI
jgi:hypothetical protein